MVDVTRSDEDIHSEVVDVIVNYPPLNADRHRIHVIVSKGAVVIKGHTRSPINRRFLVDAVRGISGVKSINTDALYDEETIRLEAGRVIPTGVLVNTRYGTVILSGKLPDGMTLEALGAIVARVPGVERVLSNFFA